MAPKAAPEQCAPQQNEKDDNHNSGTVVVNLARQDDVEVGVQHHATVGFHLVTADRQVAHVQRSVKRSVLGSPGLTHLPAGGREYDRGVARATPAGGAGRPARGNSSRLDE